MQTYPAGRPCTVAPGACEPGRALAPVPAWAADPGRPMAVITAEVANTAAADFLIACIVFPLVGNCGPSRLAAGREGWERLSTVLERYETVEKPTPGAPCHPT